MEDLSSKTHVRECNSWMFETETVIDAAVIPLQQEDKDVMIIQHYENDEFTDVDEFDPLDNSKAEQVSSEDNNSPMKFSKDEPSILCFGWFGSSITPKQQQTIEGTVSFLHEAVDTWGHFTSSDDETYYE